MFQRGNRLLLLGDCVAVQVPKEGYPRRCTTGPSGKSEPGGVYLLRSTVVRKGRLEERAARCIYMYTWKHVQQEVST